MISQLHMAKTTLIAFQQSMQVVANNVANAQTPGYKGRRMEFETMYPLTFQRAITEFEEAAGGPRNKRRKVMEYGQGVRIAAVSKNFVQGAIEITNQPYDMAISGHGLFQFRMADGSIAYGRAGNLLLDREGNFLNNNGQPLEPAVRVPDGATDIIVNDQGRVFVQVGTDSAPREIGQIILAQFQNPAGLKEIGQNLYLETDASGPPRLENPGKNGVGSIQHKALEFSNVNIIDEMMSMVMIQRIFDVAVKAVKATDEILKKGGGF